MGARQTVLPYWRAKMLDRGPSTQTYCGPGSTGAGLWPFAEVGLRKLGVLLLAGVAACARSGLAPAPVSPVAAPPPSSDPPAAHCCAPETASASPLAPPAPPSPPPAAVPAHPARETRVVRDTTVEDPFLDSLRAAKLDTTQHPATPVAPEAVRQEAADLLGPQAASHDLAFEQYSTHERVQFWLDWFTGRARRHFEIYLARLGRWDSLVRGRLAASGLPQDLVYLAMIESGMNPLARSRVGAVGLWQFMPATGRRYGLTVDSWVDERRDPYRATDAAIRFISELHGRFGSYYLAAAAYDAGPGKIQRGLREYDLSALEADDRYFALSEARFFKRETSDYVPKLIAVALMAKQPDRFGFTDIQRWQPLEFDSVQVGYAVGLDVLGRLSHSSRDVLEELNPQFYRGVTPPDRAVWVRVPVGTSDSVATRLAALPARERVTVVVHFVQRGENLGRIARQYHVTVDDIRMANRGVQPRALRPGQRLVIPTSLRPPVSIAERHVRRSRHHRVASSRAAPLTAAGTSSRVHIVRPGDTPSGIASRFGVPLSSLMRANRLGARSTIRPGQAVRIPER